MADQVAAPLAVVIDDERDIREMVTLALEHEGWRVRGANNGREALEIIREGLPGLIIVDLMMSGMSGLEFCHKLIAQPGGGNVPVLLISGINEKARLLQDFWELPLRHKNFLRKPFGIDVLLETIRGMLPRYPGAAPATQTRPAPAQKPAEIQPRGPVTSSAPTPPPWLQNVKLDSVETRPGASPTPAPAPAAAPATHVIPSGAHTDEHRTGYRVLIVDDEPDIRQIMETALGMFHTTATAENGMEALKLMDSFLPDFILSDINMPVMNGLDTAEAIRRHPVLSRVPIFFLSAERGADIPKRAYDVGGNLFLRKPVDPFRLISYIDYFLNETGLEAEAYWKKRGETEAKAASSTSAAAPANQGAVRILTVDFNIENHKLLKRLFGEAGEPPRVEGGPFELLWTEDPRTTLGNLARWQPDIILYNPRNPGFDGVAFGQTLRLQKIVDQAIVLIGPRFYDADLQYAEKVLKTPAIDNSGAEPGIARKLSEVAQAARKKIRPKKFTLEAILREEAERQRELQQANARTARERETFRQRYSKIQAFIDQNYAG